MSLKSNKNDKLSSGPSTTDSLGTSSSSNISVSSSGFNQSTHGPLIDSKIENKHKK